MEMFGRKYHVGGGSYRYGFNGKENDKDISNGGQDYGLRIYDAKLGRFLSVDPITNMYPELTPYQFASNRPIDGIDQDGLEWVEAEIAIINGKPKLTTKSWDNSSPIGIKYSDFTANIRYAENGQHYRFTTSNLSGFSSIFSSASGRENEFFPKFDAFIKDPVGVINSGYVKSVEQEFMVMVSEYGQVEMISPSRGGSFRSSEEPTSKPSSSNRTSTQSASIKQQNLTGTRNKNKTVPDRGGPANGVLANKPGTTIKKYNKDGNVVKEWNKGHTNHEKTSKNYYDHVHEYAVPGDKKSRGEARSPNSNEKGKDFTY